LLREQIRPVTHGGGLFAVCRQRQDAGGRALEVDTQLAALGLTPFQGEQLVLQAAGRRILGDRVY